MTRTLVGEDSGTLPHGGSAKARLGVLRWRLPSPSPWAVASSRPSASSDAHAEAPAAAPTIDPRSADLGFIAAIVSDQPDDASFAVGDDGGEPACRGPSSCWPLANQQSLGPG
jgi:hypothetical protein